MHTYIIRNRLQQRDRDNIMYGFWIVESALGSGTFFPFSVSFSSLRGILAGSRPGYGSLHDSFFRLVFLLRFYSGPLLLFVFLLSLLVSRIADQSNADTPRQLVSSAPGRVRGRHGDDRYACTDRGERRKACFVRAAIDRPRLRLLSLLVKECLRRASIVVRERSLTFARFSR